MDSILKLEKSVSENTWFVSDTHFHHYKLCKSCEDKLEHCRKYTTVEEMDSDIIKQWNEHIKPDDIVIFGGDFMLDVKPDDFADEFHRLRNQLNGDIYFIKGNHDDILKKKIFDTTVYNYAVITFGEKKFFVQHKDFSENCSFINKEIEQGLDLNNTTLIHGHTHSNIEYSSNNFLHKKMHNICWDVKYRPIKITEIM